MQDAIVVGAGIIGATVAKALQAKGVDVLLLDDGRANAGTPPSGGHLKPSWLGGMPKSEYEPAIELLDQVWGLHTEEFQLVAPVLGKVATTTVYRVDTDQVIATPRTIASVTRIDKLNNYPVVWTETEEYRCRLLVLATGCWAAELVSGIQVDRKQGVSFRILGKLDTPFIKPWAPYKQVVAHQQKPNEIWIGDGSALLPKNWTEARTAQCLKRCHEALKVSTKPLKTLTGWRPYSSTGKDPCLLQRLGPRVWVATGAGKSGTISAGWAARRIIDAL